MAYDERADDPAAFDAFANANVNKLVKGRFGPYAPGRQGASMGGPVAEEEQVCLCGLQALCAYCGRCVSCECRCPNLGDA